MTAGLQARPRILSVTLRTRPSRWIRRSLSFSLACILLTMCARAQTAEPQSWKGWLFHVPNGWAAQETSTGMMLHPEGSAPVNQVLLLPPEPAEGGLQSWFPAAVRRQAATMRAFRPGQMKAAKTTQGAPTLFVTGQALTG